MIRHSPLSPFHLSAASAITNLKYVATQTELLTSANKRRKLSVSAVSLPAPDSELKAAAHALKDLASMAFGGVSTAHPAVAAATARSPLKPRDLNEAPESDVASLFAKNPTVAATAAARAPLRTGMQPSNVAAPPSVGYSHHRPYSTQVRAAAAATKTALPPLHHGSTRFPAAYFPHSHHHASRAPSRPVPLAQHPQQPQPYPQMMPNPMGWMWPTVPAQQPYYHAWPIPASSAYATTNPPTGTMAVNYYPKAPVRRAQSRSAPSRGVSSSSSTSVAMRTFKPRGKVWTKDDDQRLAALVKEYKSKVPSRSFKRKHEAVSSTADLEGAENVAAAVGDDEDLDMDDQDEESETVFSYLGRRKRNTWTEDEDKELKSIVELHKRRSDKICWSTVMQLIPGRDSKQCRDRWLNHLDPTAQNTKSTWTEDEDRKLIQFIKKHGTRWRLMQSTILPNRTELTIKNRWNSAMKRRYTRFLSKRWSVDESSIQLLTSRGLLNPGVDVDQLLHVARCKMIDAAYLVGDAESSRDILLADSDKDYPGSIVNDDGASFRQQCKSDEAIKMVQVRVIKGKMDDESIEEELGVLQLPSGSCFSIIRSMLMEKLQSLANSYFLFSLDQFGIITSRQEVDLGPMGALLQSLGAGIGTEDEPFNLLVVD